MGANQETDAENAAKYKVLELEERVQAISAIREIFDLKAWF